MFRSSVTELCSCSKCALCKKCEHTDYVKITTGIAGYFSAQPAIFVQFQERGNKTSLIANINGEKCDRQAPFLTFNCSIKEAYEFFKDGYERCKNILKEEER